MAELSEKDKATIAKVNTIRYISGSVGTLAGIAYAFKKQKGFWGYIGFMLLGGIVGGTIGAIATQPMISKLEIEDKI